MKTDLSIAKQRFAFLDLQPDSESVLDEVWRGLSSQEKSISPKFFYDERGSELFDAITQLPEYYVTRTEMDLLDAHMAEVASLLDNHICVIEYGSGSTKKIRRVLDSIKPEAYVPVDISDEYMLSNAKALMQDFPQLKVFPICADITQRFMLPKQVERLKPLGFYPGSSIGNFEPTEAVDFLTRARATLGEGGYFLIGVDAKKDSAILESAYNDAEDVTARFNLNILNHLNEKVAANFDAKKFQHVANYNVELGCIQMFLKSTTNQSVEIAGKEFFFSEGEVVHTENSYKYSKEEFLSLAHSAGFECLNIWQDAKHWFSLFLLRAS
jgi:dimethylhistidine N-methyltransferase